MQHPITFPLQEPPDELSPPILSEIDGRMDGIGSLSKGPLKFNFKVQKDPNFDVTVSV